MQTDNFAQSQTHSDEARWSVLQRKVQEHNVLRAFDLFRENGIEPILIKGLAAANYYPADVFRPSIDMDLAVAKADFVKANTLLNELAADGLAIDLHRELRHLDTVEWNDLFENSRLVEATGSTYRILRPEDHLRVLCVHWLTDGGGNKERLWDIYYAIANREPDFDWDRFLNVVSRKRRRWLVCTVGLVHKYLGLDLADTPVKDEAKDLPEWLIRRVEYEWAREDKNEPLEIVLNDRSRLLKQIALRFDQNPIWATVQMEGSFDARTRIFYQIGNFFYRIPSSVRRISRELRNRGK
ncbi:MAG: nucleotidyltransferase family protein [Pyrinomonadaceae bacterium]